MSSQAIFFVGVGVFSLMLIGIVLTAREFRRLQEEVAGRRP
jgi:hypothetical protein